MATSADKFCSLCDPSPVKAVEWCSECDDFLCSDCTKHHKASKKSKQHSTISIKDYEELPRFVKELTFICEDHDKRIDSFCPVHNCVCCIRCALMKHKQCDGVAPLEDFIRDPKNSSFMKDIVQTLDDMQSFIAKVTKDKENNKQEMHAQENKIRDEIRQLRISLNDYLDQLEKAMINSLNETVSETVSHIDTLINELVESKNRMDKISKDLSIIKKNATNLQTFLSMTLLTRKVLDEEKNIEKLQESSKLKRKVVVYETKVENIVTTKSFGDIQLKELENTISYVKEADKQAQIIGIPRRKVTNIYLKQIRKLKIDVTKSFTRSNEISGCEVLENGNFLFSEYSMYNAKDRLILCENTGNFIRHLTGHSKTSLYDVTRIGQSTCALSAGHSIEIIDITSGEKVSKIENTGSCFGISYQDDLIIFCCDGEGIRTYNTKNKENKLLIKEDNFVRKLSYVCSTGSRIIYTCGGEAVKCYDMSGKVVWEFEDTSVLRSPIGVTVDKNGFCFVTGKESGNIVVISPDGKSSKEVCKVLGPRVICYDKTKHQIIACNRCEVFLFQISESE